MLGLASACQFSRALCKWKNPPLEVQESSAQAKDLCLEWLSSVHKQEILCTLFLSKAQIHVYYMVEDEIAAATIFTLILKSIPMIMEGSI